MEISDKNRQFVAVGFYLGYVNELCSYHYACLK